jgi:hypothetical protein
LGPIGERGLISGLRSPEHRDDEHRRHGHQDYDEEQNLPEPAVMGHWISIWSSPIGVGLLPDGSARLGLLFRGE